VEDLDGDIVCIQGASVPPPFSPPFPDLFPFLPLSLAETKITRAQMVPEMARMTAFDSFFSFYRRSIKGIHGTAIFTKRSSVIPVKAEEGIGSGLVPATVKAEERIGGYPMCSEVDLEYGAMKELDAEGRTTVVDCGMFVLINLSVSLFPLYPLR
jgi:AP endonuclease-2